MCLFLPLHDQPMMIMFTFFNQAPTHSTISLSSDSEPSPNGSPPEEDRSSWEEPTFFKSSKIADKDKNVGKIHGENNIAKSPSSKRSRLKSPEKGKGREVEDQVPLEKNKSGSHKKKKGITRFGLIYVIVKLKF